MTDSMTLIREGISCPIGPKNVPDRPRAINNAFLENCNLKEFTRLVMSGRLKAPPGSWHDPKDRECGCDDCMRAPSRKK